MTFRPLLLPVLVAFFAVPPAHAESDPPGFIVKNEIVPSPAAPGAFAPRLVNAPDGTVYLSWLEPAPDHRTAFRFSRFAATARTWSPARTIGESLSVDVPGDQTPQLAVTPEGLLAALWQPTTALVTTSTSMDGGANWSRPVPLNRPGRPASCATLQVLANGQLLTAWTESAAAASALVARTLSPAAEPIMIDPAVASRDMPSIAAFPDGSALVAYCGLSPDGARDPFTARFHDGRWDKPAVLISDHWKPAASPHDGPALAVRGVHLSVAWFTAAEDARVNVSTSDNAGAQWLTASRVDDVAPLGRPGLVLFDDGSQLVTWVENVKSGQVVLLRRISAMGNLSVPVQLGPVLADTNPAIARVKDGDKTSAQILVATLDPATDPSAPSSPLSTRLITLPDPLTLTDEDPCGCDPRPEDLRGYPVQGPIVSIDATHYTAQLAHGEILGVMKAGTTTVQISPEVLRAVRPGSTVLARIERTGPDWSLFSVRVLGTPHPSSP